MTDGDRPRLRARRTGPRPPLLLPPAPRERMPDALRELVPAFDDAAPARALMRIVVLAHAEARGLVPTREVGAVHADLATARDRGEPLASSWRAWARLAAAGRALHEAGGGAIIDPGPAAEGVSDAVVLAVLDRILPGLPWADLDVEAVAGAYEGLVGFDVRVAKGRTLIVLPHHVGVDLDALLAVPGPDRAAWLAEAADTPVGRRLAEALARAASVEALGEALARRAPPEGAGILPPGSRYVEPGAARRRAGAHYTPRALTAPLVTRTLAPLLERAGSDPARIVALRVCDPAMGTGAFLVEACRQLADRLVDVDPSLDVRAARRHVAARCLYGVDADPVAVDLARAALWLVVGDPDLAIGFADAHLRAGDALVGAGPAEGPSRGAAEELARAAGIAPFHWPDAFPEVLEAPRRGFDAFVGNPPWVAYAGRAAQPLAVARHDFYLRHYPSFFGYRTLHGLFIYRAASLLAPGGRLGLVVPTSVSDLGGYEPTRRAHDALCAVDAELPDFGDAFDGVFQPAMGLVSTRRAEPAPPAGKSAPWRVARDDVDPIAGALLARLAALPPLPAACFGERGFQTTGDDVKKLRTTAQPDPPYVVPIREGGDVRAFRALPPRLHLDPADLTGKLRAPDQWRAVRVLVRQTARFPIAARADGVAFRNSILAGFGAEAYPPEALLAWLNATPIRWLHYMRHRDARQGMPQVKVAHLRAIPRVPWDARDVIEALAGLGARLGERNEGILPEDQQALDDVAARALGISDEERALIAAWAERNPAP